MSTTTVESDGVWPAVEISDSSDDENKTSVSLRNSENLCSVSEQEINGGFPLLKGYESNEGSSEEEEVEEEVKMNPYLAHMEDQHKYENKLRELHLKRNEARKLNHQEVAAEDQRNKLPKNYEARRRKAEWELEQKEAKKRAMEAGENYEETKLLEETAESVDIFDRRKKKKKNQDPGFADYAASQLRQYERLTGQMKPDLESYNQSKEKMGEAAFPGAHNLMYGGSDKPSEEAIDRMVGDLEKQIEKRSKFHRRRAFHEDSDVDYINEKNMKFNKKAERYYGQYTQEIKDNLERGTAI